MEFECVTLSTQRRMRPDIARLLAPIYPKLQNHPSGIFFFVFFWGSFGGGVNTGVCCEILL